MDNGSAKTAEYLSNVADANGEDLADLLKSTGIRLTNVAQIGVGAAMKLRDNYGANPYDFYRAIEADVEASR